MSKWDVIRPLLERSDLLRERRSNWLVYLWTPSIGILVAASLAFGLREFALAPDELERPWLCFYEKCASVPASVGEGFAFCAVLFGSFAIPLLWNWVDDARSAEAVRLAKKCAFEHLGFAHDVKPGVFPLHRFESLGLLSGVLDREITDVIEGRFSGVPARVCLLWVGDKNSDSQWTQLCLIVADYPVPFKSKTLVSPNRIHPSKLFSGIFGGNSKEFRSDSEDFNRAFSVQTTDYAEAASLLSEPVVSRLLRLWRPIACEFSLAYDDGQLFAAFIDRNFKIPNPGDDGKIADPVYLDRVKASIGYIEKMISNLSLVPDSKP